MSDLLAGAGVFVATIGAAAALLLAPSPRRSAAMLIALALVPALIIGDQWHSAQIVDLRHHGARLAALVLLAAIAVAALTVLFRRHPVLLPVAIVAALPFRVPLHAGGQDANLLIPLYLVIAGGVLATLWGEWEEHRNGNSEGVATGPAASRPALVPLALAAVLVLYAIQSVYSEDFSRALQNVAFFYVPFALVFALLAEVRWDRRLLILALGVVGAEAVVFALFGFWEYSARHLIWNDEVIRSNDFHTYFRVNSLFWDPNVYGRYLALTIAALLAAVLWVRDSRIVLWTAALVAVLWLGLITTFSQSSYVALLAGMAVYAALRWSLRWTALACAAGVLIVAAFLLAAGGSLKIDLQSQHKLNADTSGRANLVSEGVALFGDRPVWGYGSGSFSAAYRKHRAGGSGQLNVSHTEPVTVAAEQGAIGLIAYVALLAAAFFTLLRGMTRIMPGLRGPPSAGGATGPAAGSGASPPVTGPAARAAILACFSALVIHTMAYAGFLEDPLTWVLLAIGGVLAATSP
jgi:putative inorganic carbon (HCO3(-)) transporter